MDLCGSHNVPFWIGEGLSYQFLQSNRGWFSAWGLPCYAQWFAIAHIHFRNWCLNPDEEGGSQECNWSFKFSNYQLDTWKLQGKNAHHLELLHPGSTFNAWGPQGDQSICCTLLERADLDSEQCSIKTSAEMTHGASEIFVIFSLPPVFMECF